MTALSAASLPMRGLMWPGVELRHLVAFRAVVEEGSFAAAALRLGYTQGAISQQIAALERATGRRLLHRPGGRARPTLTPAGEIVLVHADAIARELANARATLARLDSPDEEGTLRVGMRHETGLRLFPLMLEQLGRDAVGSVRLCEQRTDRGLAELALFGQIDVALVERAPEELDSVCLIAEEYVAVMSAVLAEAVASPLTAETLVAHPLLMLRSDAEAGMISRLVPDTDEPVCVFEADYPDILCELAMRSRGIAVLPQTLVGRLDDASVIELREPPRRRIFAAWPRDAPELELRAAFVAAAGSILGRIAGG